ncbi:maltose acetyltransferase domain-containing protein [Mesobacillus foraminis]|uniref:maltose acetyltransferase domain-containing protein n=1 Tax=Mesobacillus foraminis TaxID=279826 RepID=UPI00399F7B0B
MWYFENNRVMGLEMEASKKIHYERGTQELRQKNIRAHKIVQEFNTCPDEDDKRKGEIIKELFGCAGGNPSIEHNFHCDLGTTFTLASTSMQVTLAIQSNSKTGIKVVI